MNHHDFYRQRVAECVAEAATADLPNVRERALRAQASWQAMLDRDDNLIAAREAKERGKATTAVLLAEAEAPLG